MQNIDTRLALLPQEAFFVRTLERPKGVSDKDVGSFAQTQLEASSPLPTEVLRWGLCANSERIVYFAASADRLSRWKWTSKAFEEAEYAFPMSALLWLCPMRDGWNVFKRALDKSTFEYFAIKVSDSNWVNTVACSQPLESSDALALEKLSIVASEKISENVALFDARFARFGKIEIKITNGAEASSVSVGNPKFFERADVRDPLTLKAAKRKIFNRKLGAFLLRGAACVFAICLAWQASFFWQNSRQSALDTKLLELEPDAKKVLLLSADAAFLDGLNTKKMYNMMMLARINALRPEGISYSKTLASGARKMELRGKAQSVSVLNKFEAALKSADFVKSVEKKISTSQKDGSVWTMNLELKD